MYKHKAIYNQTILLNNVCQSRMLIKICQKCNEEKFNKKKRKILKKNK